MPLAGPVLNVQVCTAKQKVSFTTLAGREITTYMMKSKTETAAEAIKKVRKSMLKKKELCYTEARFFF